MAKSITNQQDACVKANFPLKSRADIMVSNAEKKGSVKNLDATKIQ